MITRELLESDAPYVLTDEEVVIEEGGYTGRKIAKRISYILEGGQYGLRKGYSILALGEVNKNE